MPEERLSIDEVSFVEIDFSPKEGPTVARWINSYAVAYGAKIGEPKSIQLITRPLSSFADFQDLRTVSASDYVATEDPPRAPLFPADHTAE